MRAIVKAVEIDGDKMLVFAEGVGEHEGRRVAFHLPAVDGERLRAVLETGEIVLVDLPVGVDLDKPLEITTHEVHDVTKGLS